MWDRGTWEPDGDAAAMYEKGHLSFELHGEKLKGSYHLVRTAGRKTKDGRHSWLLIKRTDDAARPGSDSEIVETRPESVLTGRSTDDQYDVQNLPARLARLERDPWANFQAARAPIPSR